MSANTIQVGGNHYRSEYQHWDFALATGMGYLESAATKYITRWRTKEKGNTEGLRKAVHYLVKATENIDQIYIMREAFLKDWMKKRRSLDLSPSWERDRHDWQVWVGGELERFATANNLNTDEKAITKLIACWSSKTDLLLATSYLNLMIAEVERHQNAATPD